MSTDRPPALPPDSPPEIQPPDPVNEPVVGDGLDLLVRNNPHTDAEIDELFHPQNEIASPQSPPRDSEGQPVHRPELIRAEGIDTSGSSWKDLDGSVPDAWFTSPADAAQRAQGDLNNYPGCDHWDSETAHPGDRVWVAGLAPNRDPSDPHGEIANTRSMSGFGVPEGELHDGWQEDALNGIRYNEGAQIAPKDGTYRPYLYCYEFRTDMPIAVGTATENTRHGDGGTPQMYVPDFERVLAEDHAKPDSDKRLVCVGWTAFDANTLQARWP
jgi:hypothetical protein